jgi:hypothetical protein
MRPSNHPESRKVKPKGFADLLSDFRATRRRAGAGRPVGSVGNVRPRPVLSAENGRSTMTDLTGRTVVLTGATDGIGRRVAGRLAEAGATLAVHGRAEAAGQQPRGPRPPAGRHRSAAAVKMKSSLNQ